MGKEEKLNPNSAWFKKHHPELQVASKEGMIIPAVEKPHQNRLVGFIKKIGQLVRKRVTSPKEN